ncbi:DUF3572 family protein [Sphingoaurantiacus capsulatus]|uniref:DUF3572 family protein n=1 Tax=Sphingoaurantiacus capsulatus TaxID=1771310 RepID=A0ABV7X9E3_9SPHN
MKSARLDAETLALRALAWIVGDPSMGPRLLALTGLDVPTLRTRAADPDVLGATLAFLEGHEASLLAAAEALDVRPQELVAARAALGA